MTICMGDLEAAKAKEYAAPPSPPYFPTLGFHPGSMFMFEVFFAERHFLRGVHISRRL